MKSTAFAILSKLSTSKKTWAISQIALVVSQFVGALILAITLQYFYDSLVLGSNFLPYLFFYLILNYFYKIIITFIEQFLIENAKVDIKADLYSQSFYAIQKNEEDIFGASKYVSNLLQNIELAAEIISNNVSTFISSITLLLLTLIVILNINLWFSLVYFLMFIFSTVIHIVFYNALSIQQEKIQASISESNHFCTEMVSGILTIKAFRQEALLLKQGTEKNESIMFNKIKYENLYVKHEFINNLLFYISEALPILLGLILFLVGQTNLGKIIFLIQFTQYLVIYMMDFSDSLCYIRSSDKVLESLNAILSKVQDTASPILMQDDIFHRPEISLRDIKISYGDVCAVSGLNLDVNCGDLIILAGESGAGKSSILNLLLKYVEFTGEYRLCGINIKDMPLALLRKNISFVSQNEPLLPISIRDNLTMGNKNISTEEIIQILGKLNLRELVDKLPQGLDTVIGINGVELSGGEAQRICIGRALLKNAPIILLDEPTSALDYSNEIDIMNLLTSEKNKNKCVIMASHRSSCFKYATRIVILDHGHILVDGGFDNLLEESTEFQKLYRSNK